MGLFGDVDWEKLGIFATAVGSLVMSAYAVLKRERRTDDTVADKRDQTLAASYRKALNETIDRYGREQARWSQERERLENRVKDVEERELKCRRDMAELESRCAIQEEQVAGLKEQVADLRRHAGQLEREKREAGEDGGES